MSLALIAMASAILFIWLLIVVRLIFGRWHGVFGIPL
jgi:hypothetical protein